jgi:hypothetical protein
MVLATPAGPDFFIIAGTILIIFGLTMAMDYRGLAHST